MLFRWVCGVVGYVFGLVRFGFWFGLGGFAVVGFGVLRIFSGGGLGF